MKFIVYCPECFLTVNGCSLSFQQRVLFIQSPHTSSTLTFIYRIQSPYINKTISSWCQQPRNPNQGGDQAQLKPSLNTPLLLPTFLMQSYVNTDLATAARPQVSAVKKTCSIFLPIVLDRSDKVNEFRHA